MQGLAQIHSLGATHATKTAPAFVAAVPRRRKLAAVHQVRAISVSRQLRQDAAGAVASPTDIFAGENNTSPPQEDQESRSGLDTTPVVEETPESQRRPRKKKTESNPEAGTSNRSTSSQDKPRRRPKTNDANEVSAPFRDRILHQHDPQAQPTSRPKAESWQSQKQALKEKFPEGWRPRKRLSPDALAGIRALNAQFPDMYTTQALADKFEVSVESIRRILKSKWQPSVDEEQARQERWFRRGKQVWEHKAAFGVKPPRKWRREGIVRDPSYHERTKRASLKEQEREEGEVRRYKERWSSQGDGSGRDGGSQE